MTLLALRQRISQADISSEEREVLNKEIARLEKEIGF
jgi:hypothetical protein